MIVIPEEVEVLIPLLRDIDNPPTYLLTYAAPVTRKMLHFNSLQYFSVPTLPIGWKPPAWLITELGIFAGRLYFDFDEYSDLRKFLGYQDNDAALSTEVHETDDVNDVTEMMATGVPQAQSFTAKPLTFLLEWLAIKRKGQNFSHTPMGHVAQGKSLTESHPFFSRVENDVVSRPPIVDDGNDDDGGKSGPDDRSDVGSDGIVDDYEEDDGDYFGEEVDDESGGDGVDDERGGNTGSNQSDHEMLDKSSEDEDDQYLLDII